MNKQLKKSMARVVERCLSDLESILIAFFETVWAFGASIAAAMVISNSTN